MYNNTLFCLLISWPDDPLPEIDAPPDLHRQPPGRRGRARIAQNARALAKAGGAKAMIKQLKKGLPTLRKLKKRARTKNQR